MPWTVRKKGEGFDIVRSDTGKVVGHSSSRKKAEASVKARRASLHNWKPKNRKAHGRPKGR